ncbi:universal stress protein [Brevibacterium antiquum]|uniref:Nucleotide-binding universal stress protein, UspA family n=1 Tax=Brevibacterium antiquum TaxID=234835 RepID=A0A2H1K0X7_9MICO|nr:universal stress protein [Brevibacterium antiquum]SMX93411.1 Nucleotide-binding universal stress protein, UspA family [Brevibacterium antiquum]
MQTQNSSQTILVGVDGSSSSVAALRHAAGLAGSLGCSLTAVMCWQKPQFYMADIEFEDGPFEQVATQKLEATVQAALGADPDVICRTLVRNGRPGEVLVDESASSRLLVMGTRGHSEFVSMLLGSVSLECIAHAHVPVVTVRADL